MNSVPFERVVKRGQIYYIHKKPPYEGSREINPKNGRPAIIVSRDEDNYMSGTVMVVYLTSGSNIRFQRETQFRLSAGKAVRSVAKCEQIATIDKQCIGDYICDISEEEMYHLNSTLMVALDINPQMEEDKLHKDFAQEREAHKKEVQMLYERNKALEAKNALLEEELSKRPSGETAENEAKMYKKLYSDLLKTLAGKDI